MDKFSEAIGYSGENLGGSVFFETILANMADLKNNIEFTDDPTYNFYSGKLWKKREKFEKTLSEKQLKLFSEITDVTNTIFQIERTGFYKKGMKDAVLILKTIKMG